MSDRSVPASPPSHSSTSLPPHRSNLPTLLAISAIDSFANMMLVRGIFFYSEHVFRWTAIENLWLGVVGGVGYIPGALLSHALARRLGDRNALVLTILAQTASLLLFMIFTSEPMLLIVNFLYFASMALKWPIIESYVSAGRSARETARAVGYFNIAWSLPVGLAVVPVGLILTWASTGLFYTAGLLSVGCALLAMRITAASPRLPDHEADHANASLARQYQPLMRSARWSLMGTYTLFYVLQPLLPFILRRLGLSVEVATPVASVVDWSRAIAFLAMYFTVGWHGRRDILLITALLMPPSFFMVLLGGHWTVVVIGLLAFGVVEGLAYYAALYYAMIVSNASVESGGHHEAMIGVGYTLGPGGTLVGKGIGVALRISERFGLLIGTIPMAALFTVGAILPLVKRDPPRVEPPASTELPPPGP